MPHFEPTDADDTRFWAVHPLAGPRPGASHPPRNRAASQMLRLLAWLAVLAAVVSAVAVLMPSLNGAGAGTPVDLLLLLLGASAVGAGLQRVARGLRDGRQWARLAGIGCAAVALLGFPVGTPGGRPCAVALALALGSRGPRIGHLKPGAGHRPRPAQTPAKARRWAATLRASASSW